MVPPPLRWPNLRDTVSLTKPRIAMMVLITAYIGYVLGLRAHNLAGSWYLLAMMLVGTGLSCMGAAALNQVVEHDTDAMMRRTADRPIASGRVSTLPGALWGLLLSIAGVVTLAYGATPAAAIVSALTIVSYVLIYTPLKRITSLSLIVGAVPGALPPVIGYAAATGTLGREAWVIFAIMFIWQVPHFLAIAWLYREDYARAEFPMLAVLDPAGGSTFRQMLLWCALLLPVGMLPTVLGFSGTIYFVASLLLGLGFLACGVAVVIGRQAKQARLMFIASLFYLPLVLAVMVLDKA